MFAETYIANIYSGSWTDLAKWLLNQGQKELYFDVTRDQFLQDANHSHTTFFRFILWSQPPGCESLSHQQKLESHQLLKVNYV